MPLVAFQPREMTAIYHFNANTALRARGVFEQLKAALQLPAECVRKGKALGGAMRQLFASGERHLLPSFFHLLRHMHAQVCCHDETSHADVPGSPVVDQWLNTGSKHSWLATMGTLNHTRCCRKTQQRGC